MRPAGSAGMPPSASITLSTFSRTSRTSIPADSCTYALMRDWSRIMVSGILMSLRADMVISIDMESW